MKAVARAAVLAGAAALACGEAPDPPLRPCDVTTRACQTDTYLAVERMRGQIWSVASAAPHVVTVPADAYQRDVATALADAKRADAGLWSVPLRDLGLLPPDQTPATADVLWHGVHTRSWRDRSLYRITLVDEGLGLADAAAASRLVYEIVRTAQDRDVAESEPLLTDAAFVRRALLEGEATLYAEIAAAKMAGGLLDPGALVAAHRAAVEALRAAQPAQAIPFTAIGRSLVRPLGGAWMARAWSRGGHAKVTDQFITPPATTWQLMRGLDAADDTRPPKAVWSCTFAVPARARAAGKDTLGAASFYAFLTKTFGREEDAWVAAQAWRGDELWSLVDSAGRDALTLWIVNAPGLASSPLGAELAARTEPPVLRRDDLVFWAGSAVLKAAIVDGTLRCSR